MILSWNVVPCSPRRFRKRKLERGGLYEIEGREENLEGISRAGEVFLPAPIKIEANVTTYVENFSRAPREANVKKNVAASV